MAAVASVGAAGTFFNGTANQSGTDTQTGTVGQSKVREKAKIAFLKPILRNDDHYELVTQLPGPAARFFASQYRNAHKCQSDLQNTWRAFSANFGGNASGDKLKDLHTTYWKKAQPYAKVLADINESIQKKNKELGREEHLGEVVTLPFRGPSLQKLKLASESGEVDENWDEESSEKHWDIICNVLNESQKEPITASWSLAAALILHHNKLLEEPETYDGDMQTGIESSLEKVDNEVQELFKNATAFEGEAHELWKKYKNLARIAIPEDSPQKVFNCSLEPIGDEEKETDADFEAGSDSEADSDGEDKPRRPDPTPDPPQEVQRLREKLGGWGGPLSMYLQSKIMAQPPQDRYAELLSQADKDIGKLDPSAMEVDSDEDAYTKTTYFVDYGIRSKLPFMVDCSKKLWENPVFGKLMNKELKATRSEQKEFENLITMIKGLLAEKKWPSNFVDAIVPPENMLVQKRMQQIRRKQLPEIGSQGSSQPEKYEQILEKYHNQVKEPLKLFAKSEITIKEAWDEIAKFNELYKKECQTFHIDKKEDIISQRTLEIIDDKTQELEELRAEVLEDPSNESMLENLDKMEEGMRNVIPKSAMLAQIIVGGEGFREELAEKRTQTSSSTNNSETLGSRFITPEGWKSPPGAIIDNGVTKKIVGSRSFGFGAQILLQWVNEGASLPSFELVASSVYKGKLKEYHGGPMKMGTKAEVEEYRLSDCTFGGVAQVRRTDTTKEYGKAPATYISISHKGVEKWFTRSNLIAVFGDQICKAEADYLNKAGSKRVTKTPGYKSKRVSKKKKEEEKEGENK
jgi:hypothetical protein